jgi:hypothetical protein
VLVFSLAPTIPMDLKERMATVREDISWSALACQSFENKLAEIAASKEKNMVEVIERIRKSKAAFENVSLREGGKLGQRWATKYAEYNEFGWLEGLPDKVPELVKNWNFAEFAHNLDPAGSTVYKVQREFDVAEQDLGQIDFSAFVRGFVQGALGVWNAVKDKL